MTGYNLPTTLKKAECTQICNINPSCATIAQFRTVFKSELEFETSCPSKATNDKMTKLLETDKIADSHLNSAKGKHQLSCAKFRFDKENRDDSEMIDGLPQYVRLLQDYPFYDEKLNAGLKYNTIFYWDSPESRELLEKAKNFSFDATFCLDSSTGAQLAVLIAIIDMPDPTRESIIVPFLYSFMTIKATEAYCEYFRAAKTVTPPNFRIETLRTDLEAAITAAIKQEFPNTRQLYCTWHFHRILNTRLTNKTYNMLTLKAMFETKNQI